MEIVPNLRPIVFWLKVRTRGPQPSICVPTFSQFTKMSSGGNCAEGSTELAPMIEFCVQGSINPEAARVESLLKRECQRN